MEPLKRVYLVNGLWTATLISGYAAAALIILNVGGTAFHVTLSALAYDVAYILLSPLAGYLGDIGFRVKLVRLSLLATLLGHILGLASWFARNPWLGVACKTLYGVAGGLATPNLSALAVDFGAVKRQRPEKVLARFGGVSAIAWFLSYNFSAAIAAFIGTWAVYPAALLVLIVAMFASLWVPEPPAKLEHSVAVVKARFKHLPEKVLSSKLISMVKVEQLVKIVRLRSFWFYMQIAVGFVGISLFFSPLPAYLKQVRGLPDQNLLAYASIHMALSSILFMVIHRFVEALGATKALTIAFALRALVFTEPVLTECLDPNIQAIILYAQTGLTWALLNTSLNTAALEVGTGGKAYRLGMAQLATSVGLLAGDTLSTLITYVTDVRICFVIAGAMEALAALTYLMYRRM